MRDDLFHVSTKIYTDGETVRVVGTSDYYNTLDGTKLETSNLLDDARPAGAPIRSKTVFAFESVYACQAFAEADRRFGGAVVPHYYRVKMPQPRRAPMALVNEILRLLDKDDRDRATEIATAYWDACSSDWKYWEVVDHELTILREVQTPQPMPETNLSPLGALTADNNEARRRWPL